MMRLRTQLRTSGDGRLGSIARTAGQVPNFSLYLWATHAFVRVGCGRRYAALAVDQRETAIRKRHGFRCPLRYETAMAACLADNANRSALGAFEEARAIT